MAMLSSFSWTWGRNIHTCTFTKKQKQTHTHTVMSQTLHVIATGQILPVADEMKPQPI